MRRSKAVIPGGVTPWVSSGEYIFLKRLLVQSGSIADNGGVRSSVSIVQRFYCTATIRNLMFKGVIA